MKTKLLPQALLMAMLVVFACKEDEYKSEQSHEEYFLNKLPADPVFQTFMGDINDLLDSKVKEGVDLESIQMKFTDATSESELIEQINQYFESPELVLAGLYSMHETSREFLRQNPEFEGLAFERKQYIIEASVQSLLKMNFSFQNARVNGECEGQLENDKQACFEGSLIGAAGCGLLSPTLIGALGCGAFVVAAQISCQRSAQRDYEACAKMK